MAPLLTRLKLFFKKKISHAGGGFFTGLSRKQRDRADHLQHAGAGVPDLVKFARHEQNGIACVDLTLTLSPCLENAFPFKEIYFVFLLVIVE